MNKKRGVEHLIGGCTVLLMLLVATASPAAADENDFLYDLNNAGIGGPPDKLIQLGWSICGQPRDSSIAAIDKDTELTEGDAGFLYDSAVRFLCQGGQ